MLLTFDASNADKAVPPYQRPGFQMPRHPAPRKYTPPGQARHLYAVTDDGAHIETMEWQYPVSRDLKHHVAICIAEDRPQLKGPIKLRKANDTERAAYISANPKKPDFKRAA